MGFITCCPRCPGDLSIIQATIIIRRGIPLTPQGFNIGDASHIETKNEVAKCVHCGWEGNAREKEGQ